MKSKTIIAVLEFLLGILLIGFLIIFRASLAKQIQGVIIGVAISFFCFAISNFVMISWEKKHPDLAAKQNIEITDERSTFIREKAKAKAGDITQWLLIILAYISILLDAPLWFTLIIVLVFIAYWVLTYYFMSDFQKKY
jgi:ABC-type uncharacterized transport system permease subunit